MNGDQVTGLPRMVTQRVGCVACPRTLGAGRVIGVRRARSVRGRATHPTDHEWGAGGGRHER